MFWGLSIYRAVSASYILDVSQIPGSLSQYCSVFHALREIGKNEGLRGLYRYVSHGVTIIIFLGDDCLINCNKSLHIDENIYMYIYS